MGCLSSLGSISNNSQNHRNIYFVETWACSRLHAKSKKSKFRIILKNISIRIADPISYKIFKRFLSSVPQPESPFAKNKAKKKKQKRTKNFKRFLSSVPQPESPVAKNKTKKKKQKRNSDPIYRPDHRCAYRYA